MRAFFGSLGFVVLACGCGARVEAFPSDAGEDAAADTGVSTGGATPIADAGSVAPREAAPPDPDPPGTWGGGPAITSLELCPSSGSVDKIIAHTSAPLAPIPMPSPIEVIPSGTTCTVIDARSSTGEYAFSGKCGLVDKSQKITVIVRAGITSVDGRPMLPGTHVFYPTRDSGRLCGGTAFFEAPL